MEEKFYHLSGHDYQHLIFILDKNMKQYSPEADIQSKNNENENIFNYPPSVGTEDFPLPQYTPFSPGEHGTKRVSTRHPKCLLGGEQKELLTEVGIGPGNNVCRTGKFSAYEAYAVAATAVALTLAAL